jgi:hypothetical protein
MSFGYRNESHLEGFFFFFFLRQGLTMYPRQALNPPSSYLHLPSTGVTGVCHHIGHLEGFLSAIHSLLLLGPLRLWLPRKQW